MIDSQPGLIDFISALLTLTEPRTKPKPKPSPGSRLKGSGWSPTTAVALQPWEVIDYRTKK